MKKIVLFMTMLLSSAAIFAAKDGKSAESAFDFKWEDDNYVEASTADVWYKVDLSTAYVASDENVLLYLNNLTSDEAKVVVTAYSMSEGGSKLKLQGPETKTIQPKRNYAIELSHSLFKNLSEVYISLQTDKRLNLKASAVEPGENDLDCLNAPAFVATGQSIKAGEAKWYMIDLSDVMSTTDKSKKITLQNNGSATANVTVGVSLDCPSTGLTTAKTTIAAKGKKSKTIDRSYFQLLPADGKIYIKVESDQAITAVMETVTVEADVTIDAPADAQEVVLDATTFETAEYAVSGGSQWFKVKVADWIQKGMLPEVTVENLSAAKAKIEGKLLYKRTGGVPVERKLTIEAGDVYVREIKKNIVETAQENAADGYVYVYVETAQNIRFKGRLKSRTEGQDCQKAVEIDFFKTGNAQDKLLHAAGSTQWYAVVLKTAQTQAAAADPHKDIMIYVENKQDKEASLTAELSAEGTCVASNTQSGKVAAKQKKSKRILYSLYKTMGDTIWVKLTSDRNIELSAELVDPEAWTDEKPCDLSNLAGTISFATSDTWTATINANDTLWYAVDVVSITDKNKVPTIKITNNTATTAVVVGGFSADCPAQEQYQIYSREVSPTQPYEKVGTSDILNQLSEYSADGKVYVRISSTQNITINVSLAFEDAGGDCAKAKEFDWDNCENLEADKQMWYAIDLKKIKDPAGDGSKPAQGIRLTITNKEDKKSKVEAELSYKCPVENLTPRSTNLEAKAVVTKEIGSALLPSEDVVYVRIKSETAINICAEGFDEPRVDICGKNWTEFDWKTNNEDNPVNVIPITPTNPDSMWIKVPLDTLRYEWVPEVVVVNGATAQTIKVLGALQCQNAALQQKSQKFEANQTLSKKLEKDMTDAYAKDNDTAYVCIIATADAQFYVKLVNPNDGTECLKAKDFDENGQIQEADATVWYKVDVKDIRDSKSNLQVFIKNQDGFRSTVSAWVYFDCPENKGEVVFERDNQSLGANSQKSVTIPYESLVGLDADYVLVKVYTSQEDSIWAKHIPVPTYSEDKCANPIVPLELNIDITQEAGQTVWYEVDLNFLKTHTWSNGEVKVYNPSVDTKIVGDLTYEDGCNLTVKPAHKEKEFLANSGDWTHEFTQELIQHQAGDKAWVKLYSEQEFVFRVSIVDSMGIACDKYPINFKWQDNYTLKRTEAADTLVNGNNHPADTTLTYIVSLDTLYANGAAGHDIRVHITNTSKVDVQATARLTAECGEEAWQSDPYDIPAGTEKSKEVSRAAIEAQGAGLQADGVTINPLYITLTTKSLPALHGNVHLWAEIIEDEILKDTVYVNDTLCALQSQTVWKISKINGIDTIPTAAKLKNFDKDTTINHINNFVYVDSVRSIFENIHQIDSIFIFNVKRKTKPETIEYTSDKPEVTGGESIKKIDQATAWLENEYEKARQDTVIGVKDIRWYYHLANNVYPLEDENVYQNEIIPDLEDTVWLEYRYQLDACVDDGAEYFSGGELKIAVKHRFDTVQYSSYMCSGKPYVVGMDATGTPQLPHRAGVIINKDTILTDTIWYSGVQGGNGDTDYRIHFQTDTITVFGKAAATDLLDPLPATAEPVVVAGAPIDFSAADAAVKADYAGKTHADNVPAAIDSLMWLIKWDGGAEAEDDQTIISADKQQLEARYGAIFKTDCGIDTVYSLGSVIVDVTHNYDTIASKQYLCSGATFTNALGNQHTLTEASFVFYDVDPNFSTEVTATGNRVYQKVYADTLVAYQDFDMPQYPTDFTNKIGAEVGKAVDYAAVNTELVAKLNALQTEGVDPIVKDAAGAIVPAWEIRGADGTFAPLSGDLLTDENPTIRLRYSIQTECGGAKDWEFDVDVEGIVARDTIELKDTIRATVCVGTKYESRTDVVTITKEMIWSEYVPLDDLGLKADSAYHYHITVFADQTLPESITEQPIAICGHEIDVEALTAEVERAFAANENNGAAKVEKIEWQVLDGENWKAISGEKVANGKSEITLRFNATTACGQVLTDTIEATVEQPTPTNVTELGAFPAAALYGGRLLVVNNKQIKEKYAQYFVGDTLKPEDVHWYKVNGKADTEFVDGVPAGPDQKDEPALDAEGKPATGFSYTVNEERDGILAAKILTGEYYAIITLAATSAEPCGAVGRTTVLTTNTTSSVIGLMPSYVRQGETLSIYGLNDETNYTVRVYNMLGTLVDEFRIEGEKIHTMTVKESQGYFMMNVISEQDNAGLKFIVK